MILAFLGWFIYCFNQPFVIIEKGVQYSTIDGKFTDQLYPSKGRDLDAMFRRLEIYKERNGITTELKIYRTTPKDFSKVCKWPDYIFKKEWRYPFLPQKKITK
jgi:hypothetical protein